MKLPLKWARAGFVLILTCLGTLLLSVFAPEAWMLFLGLALAMVQACVGVYIRFRYLRCPKCKQGACPPRWNPDGRFRCQICGELFRFDGGKTGKPPLDPGIPHL